MVLPHQNVMFIPFCLVNIRYTVIWVYHFLEIQKLFAVLNYDRLWHRPKLKVVAPKISRVGWLAEGRWTSPSSMPCLWVSIPSHPMVSSFYSLISHTWSWVNSTTADSTFVYRLSHVYFCCLIHHFAVWIILTPDFSWPAPCFFKPRKHRHLNGGRHSPRHGRGIWQCTKFVGHRWFPLRNRWYIPLFTHNFPWCCYIMWYS